MIDFTPTELSMIAGAVNALRVLARQGNIKVELDPEGDEPPEDFVAMEEFMKTCDGIIAKIDEHEEIQ